MAVEGFGVGGGGGGGSKFVGTKRKPSVLELLHRSARAASCSTVGVDGWQGAAVAADQFYIGDGEELGDLCVGDKGGVGPLCVAAGIENDVKQGDVGGGAGHLSSGAVVETAVENSHGSGGLESAREVALLAADLPRPPEPKVQKESSWFEATFGDDAGEDGCPWKPIDIAASGVVNNGDGGKAQAERALADGAPAALLSTQAQNCKAQDAHCKIKVDECASSTCEGALNGIGKRDCVLLAADLPRQPEVKGADVAVAIGQGTAPGGCGGGAGLLPANLPRPPEAKEKTASEKQGLDEGQDEIESLLAIVNLSPSLRARAFITDDKLAELQARIQVLQAGLQQRCPANRKQGRKGKRGS